VASPVRSAKRNATPIVLAVLYPKGGVGRSTTVWQLGAELAPRGKRVRIEDLDQGRHLIRVSHEHGQRLDRALFGTLHRYQDPISALQDTTGVLAVGLRRGVQKHQVDDVVFAERHPLGLDNLEIASSPVVMSDCSCCYVSKSLFPARWGPFAERICRACSFA
jgi:hypothetical protein